MDDKLKSSLDQLNEGQTSELLQKDINFDIDKQTLDRIKSSVYKKLYKPRIPKETLIFLIIMALGVYFIFALIVPGKFTGEISGYTVVLNPTPKEMEKIKSGNDRYAIKTQENAGYYLYVYGAYMNGEKVVGKYILNKEQYDSINLSTYYWFDIKYKKPNDNTLGTVKQVYHDNPIRR